MKANTPPVSDPNYSTAIIAFVNQNVPNTFNGSARQLPQLLQQPGQR